ncbi:LamG-like jellyroll fold domain-containing protein [Paenibacillus sp.]|uniref:LamG-like jellyroll fold domain-containing protein n=1 Tax=Paenibacillus sp. TaxID=58172 RepID=UPI002D420BEE|nr:GH32 C-terminal domain-containing protein [Paenibacillus sp.]HZG85829.1 GH32 C-terminal domain-containing protein [Paenibacillus sp.]
MPHELERLNAGLLAYWPFDEARGGYASDAAGGTEDEIHFALRKGKYQAPVDPIRRRGVRGNSLLFDGYSTFLRRSSGAIGRPANALTVAAWIAPRTYGRGDGGKLSAIVNQHNQEKAQGYIVGLYRDGSWSLQLGANGAWHEIWAPPSSLPLGAWTFVAATYDARSGRMALYANGEEVAARIVPDPSPIEPCGGDFLVGRHNDGVVLADAFVLNHFNGLMDELRVYDRALDAGEIAALFRLDVEAHGGAVPAAPPDDYVEIRRQRAGDRHRPQYHLSPPAHWMNEPHAPIYFNGKYHLFYQYDPQGPYWNHIHWGHWVSDDLVRWRDLPPALAPGDGFDRDGIWSGSACFDKDGVPVLFYTAGDFDAFPTQSVALARSRYPEDRDGDLTRWTKHPEPIVEQTQGQGLYGEFRDPFVWEEDGVWYMLVGTGTGDAGQGGTAAVYTSDGDMTRWTYRGPLYVSDYAKYPYLGVMWELPVLLPLPLRDGDAYRPSGKHVLLICPWGPGAKVEVNYWIGRWDREACRFTPDDEEPGLIDVGDFHFTGPSGMADPKTGRTLLFTIAQGERTPQIDYDSGWAHGAGLPVSLYLRPDGTLGVEPIEELRRLRGRQLVDARGGIEALNERLAAIQGDMLEIRLVFEDAGARRYGISLRRSPGGEEETLLVYDREREWLAVDRGKATLDPAERIGGVQGGTLALGGEPLRLAIYVDKSMIECYANERKSLTTRTYPSRSDALGLRLWADGPAERIAVEVWEMTPAFLTEA